MRFAREEIRCLVFFSREPLAGAADSLFGHDHGVVACEARVRRLVVIGLCKIGSAKPTEGRRVVAQAEVTVAGCDVGFFGQRHEDACDASEKLQKVDRLGESDFNRNLPAPRSTRRQRKTTETVFASVRANDAVRYP